MSTVPDPIPMDAWWRRNRVWLGGAVVLGALAFWLPHRGLQRELDRALSRHAVQADANGSGTYEGATWRLLRVERKPASDGLGGYVHGPAQLLVVHYEVVPDAGTTADTLDRCNGRLVDATGRRWEANAPSKVATWLMRQGLNRTCGSRAGTGMARVDARAGEAMAFAHAYLLPAGVDAANLRAQVLLPPSTTTPAGRYLEFRLPPLSR